ncbi:MAG: SAM-dependent chlorinase/fluorinase [Planctomycetes bacterium]|nr:SAM-dependent chlorinase/fluorinase [Planctomycetota bacterium]
MLQADWKPNGVVALLTDFGLKDPYVGLMKAVLLARAPHLRIVDLTHGVPAQDVRVGAFFLERSRNYFAPGTVHVGVVDPGVGSERRLIVALDSGQCFLGPDNGLLAGCLGSRAEVFELDHARCALPAPARTFHGRDLLAPAAAAIAAGTDPRSLGLRAIDDCVRLAAPVVERSMDGTRVTVEVLFCDRYGNAVLGLGPGDLEPPLAAWCARIGARRVGFAETYAQVRSGEALLLVDSFAALEIAVRDGDASAELGLARGMRVILEQTAP